MASLATRQFQPERMDDPALDAAAHTQALRGLARLNRLSASADLVWTPLRRLLVDHGELSVLDLATGSGDVPLALASRARRAGLPLRIDGCDRSPLAVAEASALEGAAGRFFQCDVLDGALPPGYAVYMCSLFLHHLTEPHAIGLLRAMACGRAVIVADLARCWPGYALARTVPRLVTRSPVVHEDARRSVRNAFTAGELRDLAARAGLDGARVETRWPFRLLLTWSRP